jgi:hypothetical protein
MNEPIAYINVEQRKLEWAMPIKFDTPLTVKLDKIPLYTHPQKELSDEEITKIYKKFSESICGMQVYDIHIFARAIIKASRGEK